MTYTYDTAGRLLTAANGTDTLTWAYDLAGQLLTEQSTKNASTVAYTYDTGGNRATIEPERAPLRDLRVRRREPTDHHHQGIERLRASATTTPTDARP